MDANDLKGLHAEVKKRMDSAIEHARKELSGLRSGRASVSLLDSVQVEFRRSILAAAQLSHFAHPPLRLIEITATKSGGAGREHFEPGHWLRLISRDS